jgi:hypothetical protein
MLQDIFCDNAVARDGIRLLFRDYDLFGPFQVATIALDENFLTNNPKLAGLRSKAPPRPSSGHASTSRGSDRPFQDDHQEARPQVRDDRRG